MKKLVSVLFTAILCTSLIAANPLNKGFEDDNQSGFDDSGCVIFVDEAMKDNF